MKKILYIIDDINYNSGAKAVTLLQMKEMKKEFDVSLLSLTSPKEPLDFLDDEHILGAEIWEISEIYATSFKQVLKHNKYSFLKKCSRILYAVCLRLGFGDAYFEHTVKRKLLPVMEHFDTVIIVSEASKLRRMVSELKNPRKIQWIHTDYALWSKFSEWSRAVTRKDYKIYPRFDQIVVLSEHCRQGLLEKMPDVTDKVAVIPNLIDGDQIIKLAEEPCSVTINSEKLNLVTVARIDREKRIDKVLQLAAQLKDNHIPFMWYIIGDGPERMEMEKKSQEMGLDNQVLFLGYLSNPYPIMAQCDTLVLLSKYEGTPVTIDEAMVLGIGVVAPRVGGIVEQIGQYKNCYLFDSHHEISGVNYEKPDRSQRIDYHRKNGDVADKVKKIL